jgi:hypothetical protein
VAALQRVALGYFDFSDTFTLADNPVLRVSQVAVETCASSHAKPNVCEPACHRNGAQNLTNANLRLSQLAVEVVRRNGSPPSTGQGGMLIVVAG